MRYAEASFPGEGAARREPVLSNSVFGMLIFICSEAMFFAALISAFLVIKSGASAWPPEGQPRLPVELTAINTLFLVASAFTLYRADAAFKANAYGEHSRKLLGLTLALGTIFVAVQGFEWIRLVSYGLTLTSSQYGSFFYLIVGIHALHAVAAIAFLWLKFRQLKSRTLKFQSFRAGQAFWYFVVGLWPILYTLVYFG